MVWSKINPKNGRKMYLRRFGNMYVLSYDKKGAVDYLPEEWDVVEQDGHLRLVRER